MSKNLADKIYTELEIAKQEIESKREEIHNLKIQMETLSYDLKGVAMIVDILPGALDRADTTAAISAFRNVSRLIEDISSSMDATLNDDSFYVA